MATSESSRTLSGKLDTLSPAKRALLEQRLQQQSRLSSQEGIPRRDPARPAPLSFAQELLWLQDQLTPGPAYNVPRVLRLRGALDTAALTATLDAVVARQEVLRTRFVTVDGAPVQVIDEDVRVPLERIDLLEIPESEREAAATRLVRERANRVFDLSADTLLRASLLQLGAQDHILLMVTHHIASDGWSRDVLFKEFSAFYDAHRAGRPAELPELPIQYADFAAWQREVMEGYALKKQLAYWKRQLAGAPAVLELPTDFPRPPVQSSAGARHRRNLLDTAGIQALKALGQQENATLFLVTLACAKVFLYRHTGQRDLVMGTPIAGRNRAEIQHLQGYFTNTLALRTILSGEMTFREVLREVRRVSLEAFDNQDLPYARLVAELNPERTLSYNPVFQVLFGYGQGLPAELPLEGLSVTPQPLDRSMSKFDLTVSMGEVETGLAGTLEYKTDLFTPETIARMMERLAVLLASVAADPDTPIDRLRLLPDTELDRLLDEWNRTRVDYPAAASLPALFEAQVARTPDATAVEGAGRTLTYAQLNAQANRLAHRLRACGVGPETTVGVMVGRSPELIVGLMGILKAGGAYVPLDENFPRERVLSVLQTAGAPVVVSQCAFEERFEGFAGRLVCLDREAEGLTRQSEENPAAQVGPENLAYVMFTSGSTGQPKGIAIPHSALVHFVRAATQTYGITPADRVLQFASIGFDTSIEEIFPCLSVGATLVIRSADMLDSYATFWKRAGDARLSFISLPTAFWHELAREAAGQSDPLPHALRLVVIGGEKARADRLELWRRHVRPGVRLLNTYGPTESTVVATACDITDHADGEIPIGRPLPNVRAYLLDPSGQPVPQGVAGELHIGGDGIARGYLNDPERTAAAFVPDPFVPGGRLYRTGDLGRFLPGGDIEFLGRRDDQVKIRGFRIEMGEIETVLMQHPQVRDAAVLATPFGDEQRIVAYIGGAADAAELRAYLQDRLPSFMVPSLFTILPALARTPGGKVDRRALPAPDFSGSERGDEQSDPQSPLEQTLADLWRQALGAAQIDLNANFFELGGHSLLAIRLLADVRRETDAVVSLAEMLQAPTVRMMARLIARKQEGVHTWSPLVPLQPKGSLPPLFCAPVGGGSAFYYRTLAEHIGDDQPLYVFEPIGMSGSDEPHTTVEEMAAYYIRYMKSVQPHGPYSLCGLSFGGMVAYEMARQLVAAGETMGALILFDSWAPHAADNPPRLRFQRLRRPIGKLHYKIGFHRENLAACYPGQRWEYVRSRTALLSGRLKERTRREEDPNPARRELPEAFLKVKKAERRAKQIYQPALYPGRLTLLRARLQRPDGIKDWHLGWGALVAAVDVIETHGSHFSMLDEPCVHRTLVHLRRLLAEARESASS